VVEWFCCRFCAFLCFLWLFLLPSFNREFVMSSPSEPRNPIYLLLLLAGLIFVITALGVALIPVLEEKATAAGNPPSPSAFRDTLRKEGWKWLLYEVAVMVVLGIASMWLDAHRQRRLQNQEGAGRMPSTQEPVDSPSAPTVPHERCQETDRGTTQAG
jgi:hypothetical protein